jgi:hypothetical protein
MRPDPRRRLILAHPERPFGGLDLVADAPARDKRTSERWVGEVDRNRIVQHASCPLRRHGPPVRAAVLVEPGGHSGVLSAETFRRDGDANADWEAPFGPRDQLARIAWHRVPRLFKARLHDRVAVSSAWPEDPLPYTSPEIDFTGASWGDALLDRKNDGPNVIIFQV